MEKIINELRYYDGAFPYEAMEEVIERKDEALPLLLENLDELLKDPAIGLEDEDYMLHMYAIYLLAQFREKGAFPKIMELISWPEAAVESLLGDVITESLSSILYSTYNGDLAALESVIENPDLGLYVRGSVLDVLGKLYLDGEISKEYLLAYLRKLIANRTYDPETEVDFNTFIHVAIDDYDLVEMLEDLHSLYDAGRIDLTMYGDYDEFVHWMQEDDNRSSGGSVKYIDDTIGEMHWWAAFQDDDGDDALMFNESNVLKKKVGRNDPCPCGSGKKYKKCCLP